MHRPRNLPRDIVPSNSQVLTMVHQHPKCFDLFFVFGTSQRRLCYKGKGQQCLAVVGMNCIMDVLGIDRGRLH